MKNIGRVDLRAVYLQLEQWAVVGKGRCVDCAPARGVWIAEGGDFHIAALAQARQVIIGAEAAKADDADADDQSQQWQEKDSQ